MDIPLEELPKLKCDECNDLLSCGPVFLVHGSSAAICGRCSRQPATKEFIDDRTRNLHYEAAAKLLAFPCSNAAQGCPETMDFSADEPNQHELNCDFRLFACPIMPNGQCDWVGSWTKLEKHCQDEHNDCILGNPCSLPRPNLIINSLNTYLVSVFQLLFLLQVKVSIETGKLFHSVRLLRDVKFIQNFNFSLKIEGNNMTFNKIGSVFSGSVLTIQTQSAICTTINSLLDILGGEFNDSKFTITINALIKNCSICKTLLENITESNICDDCQFKMIKCKFHSNGCLFVDVNCYKCQKHEVYFCQYQTNCFWCDVHFVGDSFIAHLESSPSSHNTIKSNIDSVVCVKQTSDNKFNHILLSSNNIGIIICQYSLFNSTLQIYLITSLPLYELKDFTCSVTVTDPFTKHTQILKPQIEYTSWDDWIISLEMDKFPSFQSGVNLKVNIDRKSK